MNDEDNIIFSNEEQSLNIQLILLTLLVLNDDKSNSFNEEQPENI